MLRSGDRIARARSCGVKSVDTFTYNGETFTAVPIGEIVTQVFSFNEYAWDIVAAAELTTARAHRGTDVTLPLGQLVRNFLGVDGMGGLGGRIEIKPERALTDPAVDTSRPPIVVLYPPTGLAIPVDGWHRIYKAWKLGHDTLPAYLLTDGEEFVCRVKPANAFTRFAARMFY